MTNSRFAPSVLAIASQAALLAVALTALPATVQAKSAKAVPLLWRQHLQRHVGLRDRQEQLQGPEFVQGHGFQSRKQRPVQSRWRQPDRTQVTISLPAAAWVSRGRCLM